MRSLLVSLICLGGTAALFAQGTRDPIFRLARMDVLESGDILVDVDLTLYDGLEIIAFNLGIRHDPGVVTPIEVYQGDDLYRYLANGSGAWGVYKQVIAGPPAGLTFAVVFAQATGNVVLADTTVDTPDTEDDKRGTTYNVAKIPYIAAGTAGMSTKLQIDDERFSTPLDILIKPEVISWDDVNKVNIITPARVGRQGEYDGEVTIVDPDFTYQISNTTVGAGGGTGVMPVHMNLPAGKEIVSFGLGLYHTVPMYVEPVGAVPGAGLAFLNGNNGPDFFGYQVFQETHPIAKRYVLNGITLGAVFATDGSVQSEKLTGPDLFHVADVTYKSTTSAPSGGQSEVYVVGYLGNYVPAHVQLRAAAPDGSVLYGQGDSATITVLGDGPMFIRGDCTADGKIALIDAITILMKLFFSPPPDVPCLDGADVDDDGKITLSDVITVLLVLFSPGGGVAPAQPYPRCGLDPTPGDIFNCGTPLPPDKCPP